MPTSENQKAFEAVCNSLQAGHKQGTLSPSETLNRLFQKNLSGKPHIPAPHPVLTPQNTVVTLERWSKPKLRELAPREKSRLPAKLEPPVVVVQYKGYDCLIDGGSRCHYWHTKGETDDHDVWILKVI